MRSFKINESYQVQNMEEPVEPLVNISNETDVKYGPNPINDQLNLIIRASSNGILEVNVFDINGKRVENLNLNFQRGLSEFKLDTRHFLRGIYVLKYQDSVSRKTKSFKLVKI
ncbi:MAG: T9SS type A sorting domain-containing protein [Cytophagales bacterium]